MNRFIECAGVGKTYRGKTESVEALRHVETALTSLKLTPAGEQGGFRQRVPLRNSVVVSASSAMVPVPRT